MLQEAIGLGILAEESGQSAGRVAGHSASSGSSIRWTHTNFIMACQYAVSIAWPRRRRRTGGRLRSEPQRVVTASKAPCASERGGARVSAYQAAGPLIGTASRTDVRQDDFYLIYKELDRRPRQRRPGRASSTSLRRCGVTTV
jgi:hypothetical protein